MLSSASGARWRPTCLASASEPPSGPVPGGSSASVRRPSPGHNPSKRADGGIEKDGDYAAAIRGHRPPAFEAIFVGRGIL